MNENAFGIGVTLPATTQLKIGWSETSADAFVNLDLNIKTKSDKSFSLVTTKEVANQGGITVKSVSVLDILIAQKDVNQNQNADWLKNCGPNRGYSCGHEQYVIIDTSDWSANQRTIFEASQLALSTHNIYWEDVESSDDFKQVIFDSMTGSTVPAQLVLPDTTVTKPDDPVKELFLFDGWFTESTHVTEWDFEVDVVTANIVLYAKWDFDENILDYATTGTVGVVQLSDAEAFDQLQENDLVMTEETTKKVLEDVFDELIEVLDEFGE